MRSISHVVAAELAARVKNSDWMRPFVRNAIVRIDDMTVGSIVAYFESKYGRKPVPNALKRMQRDKHILRQPNSLTTPEAQSAIWLSASVDTEGPISGAGRFEGCASD